LFTDDLHLLSAPLHPWAKIGRVERREESFPGQNYKKLHSFINKHQGIKRFGIVEDIFRRERVVLNTVI